jgi:hypothetical protein
VVH